MIDSVENSIYYATPIAPAGGDTCLMSDQSCMELTAGEAWTSIREAAREVLPEQTFRTWLSSTEAVALTDDTLLIRAPTKFAVEWIEDKYGTLLKELADREIGRPLSLHFEHHGELDRRLDFPEIASGESETELAAAEASAASSGPPPNAPSRPAPSRSRGRGRSACG